MKMTKEDYEKSGKRRVTRAFDAIRETQKPATDATNIPEGSEVEPLARFNKTDEEWRRFKWNSANYRVLESIFLSSTEPIPVRSEQEHR
jgi:hypothetical protein